MTFFLRKSRIWTYEREYRIISPYFFHRDYGQREKGCLNDHKIALDNFIKKNNNEEEMYFYKMSNHQIEKTDDSVDGGGAIGLINMPFPKKIYLGWAFNNSEHLKIIEEFCNKHQSIELIQLKNCFDHKNKQFAIR
jgi:hypothetical protein